MKMISLQTIKTLERSVHKTDQNCNLLPQNEAKDIKKVTEDLKEQ